MLLSDRALQQVLSTYGYWAVGGMVGIESLGIPVPGESVLIGAALVAGTTHRMHLWLIIAAGAAGAILGDNIGFLLGRQFGYRLLRRYGPRVHLTERRIKLGQYLFLRYGGRIVFFGRFVAILRAVAAFLAGTNRMPWRRFLVVNAWSGMLWASLYGVAADRLGKRIKELAKPASLTLTLAAAIALVLAFLLLRKKAADLSAKAEEALPDGRLGPGSGCD